MVSGEKVSINGKHNQSYDINWPVPMFMVMNRQLKYEDDSDSIVRRVLEIPFDNLYK